MKKKTKLDWFLLILFPFYGSDSVLARCESNERALEAFHKSGNWRQAFCMAARLSVSEEKKVHLSRSLAGNGEFVLIPFVGVDCGCWFDSAGNMPSGLFCRIGTDHSSGYCCDVNADSINSFDSNWQKSRSGFQRSIILNLIDETFPCVTFCFMFTVPF